MQREYPRPALPAPGQSRQGALPGIEPDFRAVGHGQGSERLQIRIRQDQPFFAGAGKADLNPGVFPGTLEIQHRALAKLRMPHVAPECERPGIVAEH